MFYIYYSTREHKATFPLAWMGFAKEIRVSLIELLVDDHSRSIRRMVIQPLRIIWCHINAPMAAVPGKRLISAAIVMRKTGTRAIIGPPPAIVKEVATIVVFHLILNLR